MIGAVTGRLRERGLGSWLLTYMFEIRRRSARPEGHPVHLLLCVADHFEPGNGNVSNTTAEARVDCWVKEYPKQFNRFRDGDNRPPQHTFFYPLEQYKSAHLDALGSLCRSGFGEVEVHLHHDRDTAQNLRQTLVTYKELLARRHGLLATHRKTGEVQFGFIHGNWALDNSRADGCWCGVNNELDVLREAGCYADFTLPSAPSGTQTSKINSIYYAVDDPKRPKSHNRGIDVGSLKPPNALLLIQGPLLLNWRRRKFGLLPRIENACIQFNQLPSGDRLDLWLKARIQVPSRPDWFFVKLHTHGAPELNRQILLGDSMVQFHEHLERRANKDRHFHFHYVTAREMYNLVKAAETGWSGCVDDARDFELLQNVDAHTNLSRSAGSAAS